MKVSCDYDEKSDVLYITFDEAEPAICYDMKLPVLIRYNSATDRVSGLTILNLKELKPESFGFQLKMKRRSKNVLGKGNT
ncbi:hypothetical protein A2Z67_00105 [Candidatus Woesebacteria bacterium RBG_13_36_22]|uniref:DUF2283 domain-containing protein n=1 Tax=Candidatus Woesebacteria bacterium RBG_13_36_22 TaxID=1802478 RepID=A0A1F7X6W5_9BACT|nr:MAG: hypothetical protein A2Z67_00105 [Candidatus Woesebacteria bacterium RBG_13_36_22]